MRLTTAIGALIPFYLWVVKETILAYGGTPLPEKVGHAFMKKRMREEGGLFGGEISGHYYFRENFCADSSIIGVIMVLNLLSVEGRPFSEVLAPLRKYHSTGEINFEVEDKDGKIEELARAFADGKQSRPDGLIVEYEDWWFNLRLPAGTSSLRLTVEGRTSGEERRGRAAVEKIIKKHQTAK